MRLPPSAGPVREAAAVPHRGAARTDTRRSRAPACRDVLPSGSLGTRNRGIPGRRPGLARSQASATVSLPRSAVPHDAGHKPKSGPERGKGWGRGIVWCDSAGVLQAFLYGLTAFIGQRCSAIVSLARRPFGLVRWVAGSWVRVFDRVRRAASAASHDKIRAKVAGWPAPTRFLFAGLRHDRKSSP
jgi:hypothetical protein